MKNYYYILLFLFLVFGCTKDKKNLKSNSGPISDSIATYLSLANEDTLSIKDRLIFTNKAYTIIQNQENDSLSRANLFKVANRYYNIGNFQEYKKVSKKVLENSLVIKDTINIARSYTYLGDYFNNSLNKDSAFSYYLKAEKIYALLRDDANLADVKYLKADVLWKEKDFSGSESAALEALKILRNGNDQKKIYEALTLLGIISNELKDYDKALEYLNKALNVVKENNLNGPEHQLAISLNNIGNVYQNIDKDKIAISYFQEALKEDNLLKDNPMILSMLMDNLAYSRFKLGDRNEQIPKLFYKSIHIKDSLRMTTGLIFTKLRLSDYYYSQNDKLQALKLSHESLELARQTKNLRDIMSALKQLSIVENQKAGIYSTEYIKINDSIQQAERKIRDKFARIQFETDEISSQNDKLEQQNRNLLLFFVGTVMIGLLLFVIRTQRAKNRELLLKQAQQKANEDIYNLMLSQQNKIEEGRIKEKKRIAQELHDGVLGRLFGARLNLDSLNKMDGDTAMEKRNNYLSELKNIEQDIREISHDLNREKFVLINNFVVILNNLLEEQASLFDAEIESNIDEQIKWENVSNSLKINLYRITQEALQNINKYAKATRVNIELVTEGPNLKLSVIDNGIGFAVDKKSKGIGLQNMVSRCNECDGTFDIKSKKGKGTAITILFPIENKQITA